MGLSGRKRKAEENRKMSLRLFELELGSFNNLFVGKLIELNVNLEFFELKSFFR
jgi:hypothetical protein